VRHGLRIAVVLLAVGVVMLAAGCGSGKKHASPNSAGPTGATGLNGATGPAGSTGALGATGNGASSFASAKNCLQFAGLAAKIASAMAPTTSGGTEASFQAESRELQAFADAAPSDIKADFQTFATAFSSYLNALQKSGYKIGSIAQPTPAQIAALTNAAKKLDTAKMQAAEGHLAAWVTANCK
jgi:hypothetical protein